MRRTGFALAAALGILALLGILAVATISVTTRLTQSVTIAERDASLAAAASLAVMDALQGWRARRLSSMAIGDTRSVAVPGTATPARVSVTRLGDELFWIVADATAIDGSRRRENLIVRLSLPSPAALAGLTLSGDATLSRNFVVVRDTTPGCAPGVDLVMSPAGRLSSSDGDLQPFIVSRDSSAADSAHALGLSKSTIDQLTMTPDILLAAGAAASAPTGVTHAVGDLTLTGGSGTGILIVDGALTLAGPVTFTGVVIARRLLVSSPGAELRGSVRIAPGFGNQGTVDAPAGLTLTPSICDVETVLVGSFPPRPVAGRRWAEMY